MTWPALLASQAAAAHAAEAVAAAPVQQTARMRQHRCVRPRQRAGHCAQIGEGARLGRQQRQRILGGADVEREHGLRAPAGRGTPREPPAPSASASQAGGRAG